MTARHTAVRWKAGGLTVAVLAGGPDVCYPPQHRSPDGRYPAHGCHHQRISARHRAATDAIIINATALSAVCRSRPSSWRRATGVRVRSLPRVTRLIRDAMCTPCPVRSTRRSRSRAMELIAKGEGCAADQSDRARARVQRHDARAGGYSRLFGVRPASIRNRLPEVLGRTFAGVSSRPNSAAPLPQKRRRPNSKQPSAAAKPLPDGLNEDEKTIVTLVRDGVSTPEEVDRPLRSGSASGDEPCHHAGNGWDSAP